MEWLLLITVIKERSDISYRFGLNRLNLLVFTSRLMFKLLKRGR